MSRRIALALAVMATFALLPAGLALGGSASAAARPAGAREHAGSGHTGRSAQASSMRSGGTLLRASPRQALPVHGGAVTSLNWSGYADVPASGSVSAVSSSFTVPSAGLVPPGFAATWTGIGGYDSSDLIQAGVAEQSLPSTGLLGDQYYAWYELLPDASVQLSGCRGDPACSVSPGDAVSVDISQESGSTWSISLSDAGRWTYSTQVTYQSSGSSAEWILEAPTIDGAQSLLAPTGTTRFGPTSTFTVNGAATTLAGGDPTQIDLSPLPVAGVLDEATPSALAGGQSFDDCAYAETCPAP